MTVRLSPSRARTASRCSPRVALAAIGAVGVLAAVGCSASGDAEVAATNSGSPITSPIDSVPPGPIDTPRTPRCAAPSDEPVELLIWHTLGDDGGQKLIELTERFSADHPDITVRLERFPSRTAIVDGLAETPPHERPDAVLADPRSLRTLADADYVVRPDECVAADVLDTGGYLPVIEATYSIDGELIGVPYNVSVPILMYDIALFREAGLDPDSPPRTLDELTAVSQAIVDSGAAPHGLIAWDGYGPWFVMHYHARRGELSGTPDNGRLGEPIREVDFTMPAAVSAFTWLRDEIEAGRAVWIGNNASGFDDLLLLVNRDSGGAMTFTTSAAVGDVARVIAAGSFSNQDLGVEPELGVAPLPGPDGGALVGGGGFFLIDSGAPSRVGATATYVNWLNEPTHHGEFAAYTGFSPLSEAEAELDVVQDAWAGVPQLRVGYAQLVDLPGDPAHAGPAWGAGDAIDLILNNALTEVVEGADPRTVLNDASTQVNQLLAIYNDTIDE